MIANYVSMKGETRIGRFGCVSVQEKSVDFHICMHRLAVHELPPSGLKVQWVLCSSIWASCHWVFNRQAIRV